MWCMRQEGCGGVKEEGIKTKRRASGLALFLMAPGPTGSLIKRATWAERVLEYSRCWRAGCIGGEQN